jgi:hypothetical protein
MQLFDWIVLIGTLLFIVVYGAWKTKGVKCRRIYSRRQQKRPGILWAYRLWRRKPDNAFVDTWTGLSWRNGFCAVLLWFASAMVVICLTFIPIYHKYKVYTAYEYLEKDLIWKRVPSPPFCSCSREVWVPALPFMPRNHLISHMGWNLNYMTIAIGVLVIIYTFQGDKSGKRDPKQQMFVIMSECWSLFFLILHFLPNEMTFSNALHIAGANDKMNIVNFSWWREKYTIWAG